MKKTILAYILNCVEELPNDFDLGSEIRQLQDTLLSEIEKDQSDVLMNLLFVYCVVFTNDYQLGLEVRNIYNEMKYYFDEYTNDTHTDSN